MSSSASLMEVDASATKMNPNSSVALVEDDKDAKWFDLHPSRELLDSSFEGYKLSLDSFAQYKLPMGEANRLDTYNFIESSDSKLKYLLYQHLKLYGMQNLLVVSQFNDADAYYFDHELRLIKIVYAGLSRRGVLPTTLQLPAAAAAAVERTHATMRFVRDSLAVVFDGHSNVYVCERNSSGQSAEGAEEWRIVFTWSLSERRERTCVLKDAVLYETSLHVMLVYVDEVVDNTNQQAANKFDTVVNWLQFDCSNGYAQSSLKRTRKLNCYKSVPDYIGIKTYH